MRIGESVPRIAERLRAMFAARGRFFRDVTTLLSGALVSRLIAVLAIPVLARLYTPAEFGVLAMFMTVNTVLSSIACARYEMAVVLPEDDSDAIQLFVACIAIVTGVSLLTLLLFTTLSTEIGALLGTPDISPWLWLSAVVVWLIGVFNALQSWASRTGAFGGISRATVGGTLVTVVVQFLLVFPQRITTAGLIVGQAAGRLAQAAQLWLACRDSLGAALRGGVSFRKIRHLLGRYRNFPLYDSGASLLNASSRELPVLLLGVFFSPTIIGFYAVGRRMLKVPMQLVGNAISRVFFPKARLELQKGRLDHLVSRLFGTLVAIGVAPMLAITIVAPDIVQVFLGGQWAGSGVYVQWLSIWLLVVFVTAPLAQLFNVLEKQRARLLYQTVLMAARLGALVAGGLLGDPVLAVAAFSIVSAAVSLLNGFWLLDQAGMGYSASVRCLGRELLLSAPWLAAVLLASFVSGQPAIVLLLTVGILGGFMLVRHKEVLGDGRVDESEN